MWKDSETELDFLDFDYLKGILKFTINNTELLPASIGVYGDWGSGKSSLIKMSMDELQSEKGTVCLKFNGWLFEGYEDAKTALMGSILDVIEEERKPTDKAKKCIKGLYNSIDKLKLLKGGLKFGADMIFTGGIGTLLSIGLSNLLDSTKEKLTAENASNIIDGLDLEKIKENIQSELSNKEIRNSIKEFQKNFEELLKETKIERLVVFVDELDRCSPDTILETLEAIRLFLFVGNVAFIIGADERHIAYAIKQRFDNIDGLQINIGKEYLEKIIQYPIKIPRLNAKEVEFYITCLLLQKDLNKNEFDKTIEFFNSKKKEDFFNFSVDYTLLANEFPGIAEKVKESLIIAKQLGQVLARGLNGNPRQCKRFLNSLYMRIEMAKYKKIDLDRKILAKLMLLEYFKETLFKKIAELEMESGENKDLKELEEDDTISSDNKLNPWGEDVWVKNWCKIEPKLADTDLTPYFYFTRTSLEDKFDLSSKKLSPKAQEILTKLLSKSDTSLKSALKDSNYINDSESSEILKSIFEVMVQEPKIEIKFLKAFIQWGLTKDIMITEVTSYLASISGEQLKVAHIPWIKSFRDKLENKQALDDILDKWKSENSNLTKVIDKEKGE
ncbi:MAG: P-loop NTPase fold protein [Clostridium perfringens]